MRGKTTLLSSLDAGPWVIFSNTLWGRNTYNAHLIDVDTKMSSLLCWSLISSDDRLQWLCFWEGSLEAICKVDVGGERVYLGNALGFWAGGGKAPLLQCWLHSPGSLGRSVALTTQATGHCLPHVPIQHTCICFFPWWQLWDPPHDPKIVSQSKAVCPRR